MPHVSPPAYLAPDQQHVPIRPSANKNLPQLFPLLLVFYSFLLLPPEVNITVFGINLPSYRIALLPASLWAFWISMKRKSGNANPMDIAITTVACWIMLSFMINYGFQSGLVRGAGVVIDTALSYFVARVCVKSQDDLRLFLILCVPALAFAGGTMALESLTGRLILRPSFASLFGNTSAYISGEAAGIEELRPEYRFGGLLRAYGPFPHPILGAAILIGFLPLYYFSSLRSWPYVIGISACSLGFFGLSSAALLAMILTFGAIAIYHIKPHIPKTSWWMISGLMALMVCLLHMASSGGISYVIARMTLSPGTAYYRILIWEYGSKSVAMHPWFGIGYKDWERPDWMLSQTVDAHFLALAIRDGLIVPTLLLVAVAYGMVRLGLIIPYFSPKDRMFAVGINICLLVFMVVGQTVTYFGSGNVVFMSVIAFLASIVTWGEQELRARRRLLVRRFARKPYYPGG